MCPFVVTYDTGSALKEYDFWRGRGKTLHLYMLFIMGNCFCHLNKLDKIFKIGEKKNPDLSLPYFFFYMKLKFLGPNFISAIS